MTDRARVVRAPGRPGRGLPRGGTPGQVPVRGVGPDFTVEWGTLEGGGDVTQAALDAEIAQRESEVSFLTAALDSEVARAQGAETLLDLAIEAEITARAAAITAEVAARQAAITAEAADREAADDANEAAITAEATARAAAVLAEAVARAAADALLIPLTQKGAANGVASLGADGRVPSAQIPATAFSSIDEVADEAAMLALSGRVLGALAIRPDAAYVLKSNSPSTLADWIEFPTAVSVTSVDGQIGIVDLSGSYATLAALAATAASLTTETTARAAADTTLQTNITAEATARAAADTTEATTRAAADVVNANAIAAEVTARVAAVAAEAALRISGDAAVSAEVAAEATARIAGDAAEATARVAAVNGEAATRLAADVAHSAELADVLARLAALEGSPVLTSFIGAHAYGGGTCTDLAFSPDGLELWAGTDVGGMKKWEGTAWRTVRGMPSDTNRYVAGVIAAGSGRVIMAAGATGVSGVIAETVDGGLTWTDRTSSVFFSANSNTTTGYARPRAHRVLTHDRTNDIVYAAGYDGVWSVPCSTWTATQLGLDGVQCRGVALLDEDHLLVATLTQGLVLVSDVRGTPRVHRVSPTSWPLVEDVVAAPTGSTMRAYLAGDVDGAARLGQGYVTVAGAGQVTGPAVSVAGAVYELGCCVDLTDRAGVSQSLLTNWDSTDATVSGHRLRISSAGVLEYIFRSNVSTNVTLTFAALPAGSTRLWIRVRRTAASGADNFTAETSTDGVTWTTLATASSSVANLASQTRNWVLGGTHDGVQRASGDLYHGWVSVAGVQVLAPCVEGLAAGDASVVDPHGNTWTLTGTTTIVPGLTAIAPSFGTVGTGGTTRCSSVDALRVSGADRVVWGHVNPAKLPSSSSDYAWVTRSEAGEAETGATCLNATRNTPTLEPGTAGAATTLLGAAGSSVDGDGTTVVALDPVDAGHLVVGDWYQIWETRNLGAGQNSILWSTKSVGYQILTYADGRIDADGTVLVVGPDYDAYARNPEGVATRLSVTGVQGMRCCDRLGNLVVAGGGERDTNVDGLLVWDYVADLTAATWNYPGVAPLLNLTGVQRVSGVKLIDLGTGVYRCVWLRDAVGFQWADFTTATETWSAVTTATGGPTAAQHLTWNHHTSIVGTSSVLFGLARDNGSNLNGLFRSLNDGATWTQILSSTVNKAETLRRGFLAYDAAGDVLYVSDVQALRRVSTASGTPSSTTMLTDGDLGPVTIDPVDGSLWVTQEESASHRARLLRFAAPSSSTEWTDMADDAYRAAAPLATSITISGGKVLVTGQGTGTGPA